MIAVGQLSDYLKTVMDNQNKNAYGRGIVVNHHSAAIPNKKQILKTQQVLRIHLYLGGESNPYLKIRNFPFYPLNYQGMIL